MLCQSFNDAATNKMQYYATNLIHDKQRTAPADGAESCTPCRMVPWQEAVCGFANLR